ncbi:TIGR01777 family oxidoreductase [Pedobacter sp. Du54]|uniref:TIGR01777 family oxidoreductase n=1 Tax=Pedobacter anseongensis TaxID=3133439 RepID=UPI00309A92F8
MSKNILITGATGLVGKALIPNLLNQGHRISVLSRKKNDIAGVNVYSWDVRKQIIDTAAFEGVDTIIHLAGEGIADKKWTDKRKAQIINSRVKSAELLYKTIRECRAAVTTFISASAVGYYGDRRDEFLWEDSDPGKGFLSNCCLLWEAAADEGMAMGIRVVKVRIGIILSKENGALVAMAKPIKFFVGAPLGSGKQWMPWIHIDDIVGIFTKAVEDEAMVGAYNGAAPYPSSNKLVVKRIAWHLGRPVWPINVPKFLLKTILGERCILVLMSTNTAADKIVKAGYVFKFTDVDAALKEIYG